MDDVLLPGLYEVKWYNGELSKYKEGFISNKRTFLLGMPRLRQLRMKTSKAKTNRYSVITRHIWNLHGLPVIYVTRKTRQLSKK